MNEPFFSEELLEALDQVNHHLEICCGGVGAQVEMRNHLRPIRRGHLLLGIGERLFGAAMAFGHQSVEAVVHRDLRHLGNPTHLPAQV